MFASQFNGIPGISFNRRRRRRRLFFAFHSMDVFHAAPHADEIENVYARTLDMGRA